MEKYQVKSIGHLGIVAGICNEISLIENIDKLIPTPRRKVSVGQAVQSIILNALGFTNRAMYLHPRFNHNLPLDILSVKESRPKIYMMIALASLWMPYMNMASRNCFINFHPMLYQCMVFLIIFINWIAQP